MRIGPLTPRDPDRIDPVQAEAIAALTAAASADEPAPGHHGHSEAGPETTAVLSAVEQATFDEEWAGPAAAVDGLDTPGEASAADPHAPRCTAPASACTGSTGP